MLTVRSPNTRMMPPGSHPTHRWSTAKPRSGQDGAKLIGNPGFTVDWQINKLEVGRAGDLAYTIYTYQMTLNGANGKPITDQGKDMAVWKKQLDGAWKMVADTFNSDLAVKSQAKTPETKHQTIKHRPRKRRRIT